MPAAVDARFDDVGIEIVVATVELGELFLGGNTSSVRRQASTEDIGDEDEVDLFADRTRDAARRAEVLRGADQFGVRIADLVSAEATAAVLVDDRHPFEAVIDHGDAAPLGEPARKESTEKT